MAGVNFLRAGTHSTLCLRAEVCNIVSWSVNMHATVCFECCEWVVVKHAAIAQLNGQIRRTRYLRLWRSLVLIVNEKQWLHAAVHWIAHTRRHKSTELASHLVAPQQHQCTTAAALRLFGLLKLAINALKHKWIYIHAARCYNPFPFPCCMQQHAAIMPRPHQHIDTGQMAHRALLAIRLLCSIFNDNSYERLLEHRIPLQR